MKQFFTLYLFPFFIALIAVYYLSNNNRTVRFILKNPFQKGSVQQDFTYIANFENDNVVFEEQFLKSNDSTETIFLLGSSELVYTSPAIPYNFIPQHFKTKLKAVGHAGNQCFSIYTQLLANYQRLQNAPVVIILSPGWFESKASKGTSSKIFLEFNSESFLKNINTNHTDNVFTNYASKRIHQLYSEFSSPNLELKKANFSYLSSVSILHKIIFSPLVGIDNILISYKEKTEPTKPTGLPFTRKSILTENILIKWDSLFSTSKQEVISKATNNNLGVENNYYIEHIHGKIGHMQLVPQYVNQELEDFKMLVQLVKEKKMNVRFIISTLNPYYYKNLSDLLPTVNTIENEIKANKITYLNLFETDSTKYDKATLRDIMHMSDYGWYKVDQFIINTYALAK